MQLFFEQAFIFRDTDFITMARVGLAFILGGIVGYERERVQRPAGLRTHMLVCAGSACFTVASVFGFEGLGTVRDPARLAAQIITGIGFLGAGTIFRTGSTVRGLTTASSIWITAAIGIVAGLGLLSLAVFTTLLTWIALFMLKGFEARRARRVAASGEPSIVGKTEAEDDE
ncbi:MAG TPA: MgtC/SapB family protein [Chloroflexia bacterium]|jgi:putative Mg2+ transporter-C (MgtC) family protein